MGVYASSAKPGSQTTLNVNVRPAGGSTGIAVTADCSAIGGSATQSITAQMAQYSYVPFMANVAVASGTALGTYNLPVTATDLQGNSASTTIAVTIQNTDTDAQLQMISSEQGDRFTTGGFQIVNGGSGYTASSTLQIDGQDTNAPYGSKTVNCTLSLDANGSITGASGGEGIGWYGPPDFTLTR